MLAYTLYGLFILSCITLILVILLQPGKSGAGDLFSSSVSSTAFGPRGTATLLSKITIGAAAAFMITALTLSLPAVTGTGSIMQSGVTDPVQQPSPAATPQPTPATVSFPKPQPTSTVISGPSPKPTKK